MPVTCVTDRRGGPSRVTSTERRQMRILAIAAACAAIAVLVSPAHAEHYGRGRTLHAQARYVALHGGIRSSCYGCATNYMKSLSRRLVIERFSWAGPEAVRWALCVVGRESDFNPGAVNSSSGAAGLFQFLGHPQ